jgi:transcription elongation factor GreA-like protein
MEDPIFGIGEAVNHPTFGSGEIISVNENERTYTMRFDGISTECEISFETAAKILLKNMSQEQVGEMMPDKDS